VLMKDHCFMLAFVFLRDAPQVDQLLNRSLSAR
jgi:hypothetical protein